MANAAGARRIGHTYEAADLEALEGVVDTVIGEIVASRLYLSEPGQTEALRLEVAAAVFAQTEGGDRDPASLAPRIRAQFADPDLLTASRGEEAGIPSRRKG